MRYVLTLFLLLPFFAQAQQACLFELEQPETKVSTVKELVPYFENDWLYFGDLGTCYSSYVSRMDNCGNELWTTPVQGILDQLILLPDSSLAMVGLNVGADDIGGDEAEFYLRLDENGETIDSVTYPVELLGGYDI